MKQYEQIKDRGTKTWTAALIIAQEYQARNSTLTANWDNVYASWKSGEITAKTTMELTGTKRTSFTNSSA